jgi:DNA-binding LacI/PurR family transcriptional regulator
MDRAAASRLAVDHLVQRGRQRIGFAEAQRVTGRLVVEEDKRTGYLAAMAAHGLTDGAERIALIGEDEHGPDQDRRADEVIDELVVKKGCDAILFTRDWAALGIKALKRRGYRVPQDVAVVGFDNREFASLLDPELTAIDHRHLICAEAMMNLVIRLVEEGSIPPSQRGVMIAPTLVVRQSS